MLNKYLSEIEFRRIITPQNLNKILVITVSTAYGS